MKNQTTQKHICPSPDDFAFPSLLLFLSPSLDLVLIIVTKPSFIITSVSHSLSPVFHSVLAQWQASPTTSSLLLKGTHLRAIHHHRAILLRDLLLRCNIPSSHHPRKLLSCRRRKIVDASMPVSQHSAAVSYVKRPANVVLNALIAASKRSSSRVAKWEISCCE
ncbi:hypothetical protein DIZ76_011228 [Coccidioides immitis]|nr:hypothetical protein DIZ76_011228 [Coccidioides immitis]